MKMVTQDNYPHLLRCAAQALREQLDSPLTYLVARWWQVSLGKKCSFCGVPKFRRTPGSTITIGNNCRFLSTFSSNLHGLNRPCMLSTLTPQATLTIGHNTGLSGTVICAAIKVEIGNRVMCGANTLITDTSSHSLDFRERHPVFFKIKDYSSGKEHVDVSPILIEDDVFLGTGVTVLKGVTIGRGTVVGAGSIVTNSLPPYVIAAGQPAKPIKALINKFPDIKSSTTQNATPS